MSGSHDSELGAVRLAADEHRWSDVLTLSEGLGPRDERAAVEVARLRARALWGLLRSDEARSEAARAAALAEPLGAVWADCIVELARCSPTEDREDILRRAVALAERRADSKQRAPVRRELAHMRLAAGDVAGADALLQEIEEEDPDVVHEPRHATARAAVARQAGDREALRRWLQVAIREEDPIQRAFVAHDLAMFHLEEGDPDRGIVVLERALAVADRAALFGRLCMVLGDCHRGLGNLDAAENSYREALQVYEVNQNANLPIAQANLGMVMVAKNELPRARTVFEGLHRSQLSSAAAGAVSALGLCVCAAASGDESLWSDTFGPYRAGLPDETPLFSDCAWLATLAAKHAEERGWLDDAARASRVALQLWQRLGRPDDVLHQQRALQRLADSGARVLVGPFLLDRLLGEGSFGRVWLASHPSGTEVALKVLTGRDHSATHLDNELIAVAGLDHPHIVQLLHHGQIDDCAAAMGHDH